MKRLAVLLLLIFACGGLTTPVFAFDPGNVECIAPANPGGGWDFTCRQVGKTLYDLKLVPGPVQVTNMPGASGGVAFGYVVSKRDKRFQSAGSCQYFDDDPTGPEQIPGHGQGHGEMGRGARC